MAAKINKKQRKVEKRLNMSIENIERKKKLEKLKSGFYEASKSLDKAEKLADIKADNEKLKAEWERIACENLDLKASLPKVRADAVRGLITAIEGAIENDYISMKEVEEMGLEDFCNLAERHSDKLEAGNE